MLYKIDYQNTLRGMTRIALQIGVRCLSRWELSAPGREQIKTAAGSCFALLGSCRVFNLSSVKVQIKTCHVLSMLLCACELDHSKWIWVQIPADSDVLHHCKKMSRGLLTRHGNIAIYIPNLIGDSLISLYSCYVVHNGQNYRRQLLDCQWTLFRKSTDQYHS